MADKVKITDLREMTRDELAHRRRDLEDELFNLRMRKSMKQLENPLRLRKLAQARSSIMDKAGKKGKS